MIDLGNNLHYLVGISVISSLHYSLQDSVDHPLWYSVRHPTHGVARTLTISTRDDLCLDVIAKVEEYLNILELGGYHE